MAENKNNNQNEKHKDFWLDDTDKDDWIDDWAAGKGYPGQSYHERKKEKANKQEETED